MVDKESPDFLFFCGSSLCFDVVSLFNAARPNFNSRSNNMGGAVSVCSGLECPVCSGLECPQVLLYSRRPACG